MKPRCFNIYIGDTNILTLDVGRHNMLTFGGPRDKVVSKEDMVTRSKMASLGTFELIRVGVRAYVVHLCG